MVNQNKDIRVTPQYPILIYVDSYTARIISSKPAKDQNGNDVFDLILAPTEELIKRYNIQFDDPEHLVQKFYPAEFLIPLNDDPARPAKFYLKTYDDQFTPASEILKGTSQQRIIQELKEKYRHERAKREVDKENLNIAEKNIPKFVAKNVAPIIETLSPAFRSMITKDPNQPNER